MFSRKARSKSSLNVGSKESLESNLSRDSPEYGSSENVYRELHGGNGTREFLFYGPRSIGKQQHFLLHYLGSVDKMQFHPLPSRSSREGVLVDKVEQAQLEGKLPFKPAADRMVRLFISKHGVQVIHAEQEDVLLRIPLHTLAQLVHYDDGLGKHNLAVKVIVGNNMFSCHVFVCPSEEIAVSVCQALQNVFRHLVTYSI